MSGPVAFSRETMTLDHMTARIGGPGWEGVEREFAPAAVSDQFKPEDRVMIALAGLYRSEHGRAVLEWLFDLTFRAPYPHVGSSKESVVIAAAKHEARAAVGHVVCAAIQKGEELISSKKGTA